MVALVLLVAAAALVGLPVAVDVHGLPISRCSLNKWSFPLHVASRVEHLKISPPSYQHQYLTTRAPTCLCKLSCAFLVLE